MSFCLLRPVISRITEHDDSNHAMCFGVKDLYSSKWPSVLCESNLACEADIGRRECCEVVFVTATTMRQLV
jgi:hypothetical protein